MNYYTIFCIDLFYNPHAMNVFHNWMNDRNIGFKPVVGCYQGERESGYTVSKDDFDKHIRDCPYIRHQESVLHVAGGNKMESTLEYLADGHSVSLGCMHVVCKEEAALSEAWTYRPDMNTFWVAKHGNPDGSYRRSVETYRDTPPVFDNCAVAAE